MFSFSNKNSGGTVVTDPTSMMALLTQVLSNILFCLHHLQHVGFSSLCLYAPGHEIVMTWSACFRQQVCVQGRRRGWGQHQPCVFLSSRKVNVFSEAPGLYPLLSHWPVLCHVTTPSCKGCQKNEYLPFSGFIEVAARDMGISNGCMLAN